jgi:N-acyl-D-amino-acid deacylase
MRACTRLLLLFLLASALLTRAGAAQYDLVLRGGRVVDGTGNPAFAADVAVKDGRVAAVGRIPAGSGPELDARGMVVAPGFIDVHTHAENIRSLPQAPNFVRMGVTSIVTGNCGGSALNVGEFFRNLEETKVAINVATLIGHNTVRREAMGGSFQREPTGDEMEKMKALTEQAMKDGAVGLSTGLIYLPGTFSRSEEIVELARVAAAHDGIYSSHMRNEATGIFGALEELFRVAREAKIRAEISHIKLSGNSAWGKANEVLAAIEKARAEGLDITQDQYVYTASSTNLGTLIPSSAREGTSADFRRRIEDPEQKAKIIAQMRQTLRQGGRNDYSYAVIASYSPDRSLNGKSIPQAAKIKRGSDSLEDQIELILEIEKSGGGSGIYHGMNEEDLQLFLRHPNTMVASDGGPREPGESVPHPRSYGNNARVFARYVRELKVLRLEDAVRRMTSLPAGAFRLRDRGIVREGAFADLVVFDPAKVQDDATFNDPHHYSRGMTHVLVNGVPVIRSGQITGQRPGMPLRLGR